MYIEKKEFDVKRLWSIAVGIAGLGITIYLFFGHFFIVFGLGNIIIYFIEPLILVYLWSSYRNLNASHNALCNEFRNLRAEVNKLKSDSK